MARRTGDTQAQDRQLPRKDFALAERPGYLLHKAALMMAEEAEAGLEAAGMKTRVFFVLASLAGAPDLSQQDLSRLLNLDPTTVVSVIDDLEDRKYVQRQRNPSDRRRYLLNLTDTGREALAATDQVATELEASFFATLSPKERTTLLKLLSKLMAGRWPASVCP